MLTPQEVATFKDALDSCNNPFIFFHDDPDGLCSFLLCYRYKREGKGMPLKAFPKLTEQFARHPNNFEADRVFVLDIALVDQEFINEVKAPIIWLDHHPLQQRDNITYLNPRARGQNIPTPVLCWQALAKERPEDLWIATVGSVGDWYLPPYADEFRQQFPELLPADVTKVEQALFGSKVGQLVKVMSFNLKGPTNEVEQSVEAFIKIKHPDEILQQSTPAGKLVWQRYEKINEQYERMLTVASEKVTDDPFLVYLYPSEQISLTKDVANELLFKFPDKIIIVGRRKDGEVRCSIRGAIVIAPALERALGGVRGHGGGHEHACGAGIAEEDFDTFLEAFKRELGVKVK